MLFRWNGNFKSKFNDYISGSRLFDPKITITFLSVYLGGGGVNICFMRKMTSHDRKKYLPFFYQLYLQSLWILRHQWTEIWNMSGGENRGNWTSWPKWSNFLKCARCLHQEKQEAGHSLANIHNHYFKTFFNRPLLAVSHWMPTQLERE